MGIPGGPGNFLKRVMGGRGLKLFRSHFLKFLSVLGRIFTFFVSSRSYYQVSFRSKSQFFIILL